jgi:hypothetical protein
MSSKLKTVNVQFKDTKYNYITNVSSSSSKKEIERYFVGQRFNLGTIKDNVQICTSIKIN